MHAADDVRVPFEQSSRMTKTLGRYGKDVRFVKLPDDGHELDRTATRVTTLRVAASDHAVNTSSIPASSSLLRKLDMLV
jgi:dipeptidyl aminopeptidase/acylaminoacyl peptidase